MMIRYVAVAGFIIGIFFGPFGVHRSSQAIRVEWFAIYIAVLCMLGALFFYFLFRGSLQKIRGYSLWKIARIVLVTSVVITIGMGRYLYGEIPYDTASIPYNKKIIGNGVIISEPDVRGDTVHFIASADFISDDFQKTHSKIIIYQPLTHAYRYGDAITFSCAPKFPEQKEKFDYYEYLARFGARSVCWPTALTLTARDQGNWFMANLFLFKSKAIAIFKRDIREPYSAFLRAMILNDRSDMSEGMNNLFRKTGTSHIIAISGLHFVILFTILETILYYFFRRRAVFFISTIFLIAYSALVGFPGSVVRAGTMLWVLRAAHEYKRAQHEGWILWLTVAILLFINPYLLRGDIGFTLSVAAIAGIMYLKPLCDIMTERIELIRAHLNKTAVKWTRDLLTTAVSATIFTMPIIAYYFGTISLISIIVNLIAVPISSFILGCAVSLLIMGLFTGNLVVINWFIEMMTAFFFAIIRFFANIPFAQLTEIPFHLWTLVASYAILIMMILYGRKKTKL